MSTFCQSLYLWQLLILFIKFGKVDPEGVWLPNCLVDVYRLHCLSIRIDDLGKVCVCVCVCVVCDSVHWL